MKKIILVGLMMLILAILVTSADMISKPMEKEKVDALMAVGWTTYEQSLIWNEETQQSILYIYRGKISYPIAAFDHQEVTKEEIDHATDLFFEKEIVTSHTPIPQKTAYQIIEEKVQ